MRPNASLKNSSASKEKSRDLFFVSLPYANHHLHLGHIIGTFIPSHICFLHSKKRSQRPLYISGLDCHGTGTYISALEQNLPYAEFIKRKQALFKRTLSTLGIDLRYDFRTYSKSHDSYVNTYILDNIDRFFVKEYSSLYCFKCNLSLNDRFVVNQSNQYLEKIIEEKRTLDQSKLYCFFCRSKVVERSIKGLFLKYPVEECLDIHKRKQNVLETQKLVTRNIVKNGVRCSPLIDSKLGCSNTYYVWIQALLSYKEQVKRAKVTSTRYCCKYFFAKDNLYYHTIVYPSLIGPQDDLSPIKQGNAFYMRHYCNFKGSKMSSSLKNILTLDDFKGYNMDVLRYALAKADPFLKDTDISKEVIQNHYTQYIKNYINLGKRIRGLRSKVKKDQKALKATEDDLWNTNNDVTKKYDEALSKTDVKAALEVVQSYCSLLNIRLSKLISDSSLSYCAYLKLKKEYCFLMQLLYPFTPKTSIFLKKYVNKLNSVRCKLSYCMKTFKISYSIK